MTNIIYNINRHFFVYALDDIVILSPLVSLQFIVPLGPIVQGQHIRQRQRVTSLVIVHPVQVTDSLGGQELTLLFAKFDGRGHGPVSGEVSLQLVINFRQLRWRWWQMSRGGHRRGSRGGNGGLSVSEHLLLPDDGLIVVVGNLRAGPF